MPKIVVVFPIYVGVILVSKKKLYASSRIPHIRGGDPANQAIAEADYLYSPYTWG